MLRVLVCATHMGWFLGPNFSLNLGPFFGSFSLNIGGFQETGEKLPKMGSSPPVIIKVVMTATVGN